MQQYELEAWLGPALADMTPDQVDAMARYADAIKDRYDDEALRGLAAGGALLVVLSDSTLEQIGGFLRDQRVMGFNTSGEQFNGMHINQTFTGVAIARGRAPGSQ